MTAKYSLSFIIAAREVSACHRVIESINNLKKDPIFEVEVIVATGSNPSGQRNFAARSAKGEYLIFLDDDSIPCDNYLCYLRDMIENYNDFAVVGGPSCQTEASSLFQNSLQIVFSSVFGLGPVRARYVPLGPVRSCSEYELILCNMIIKKNVFLDSGGFNRNLYPNEENELINRLSNRYKFYYHPMIIVYRELRGTVHSFIIQMFEYGKGRAKHFALSPSLLSSIFFIPTAFLIYILSLPLAVRLFGLVALIPLFIYLGFAITSAFFHWVSKSALQESLLSIPLFLICHLSYGLGLLLQLCQFTKIFDVGKTSTNYHPVKITRV